MKDYERLKMLEYPEGILDLVIDTDAATEVDDPFAIAYALRSPERLRVRAVYAAPFAMNEKTQDPEEGMLLSYREIRRVIELCGLTGQASPTVCRGSRGYLTDRHTPRDSQAARHLIDLARDYDQDHPLYVAAIGAITNIASALLLEPALTEKLVVVWLAGNDFDDSPNVYNIYQDRAAAQIMFDSGVPLVHVPCNYVASHLLTGIPELTECIGGRNALCDYLVKLVRDYGGDHFAWGKQIWDIGVIAFLLSEEYARCEVTTAPIITSELTWSRDYTRHLIKNVKELNRDAIFRDLYYKLRIPIGVRPK